MTPRRAPLLLAGLALLLGPAVTEAAAARSLTRTYTASAPTPEPVTQVGGVRGICDPALASAKHEQVLRTPSPGRLTVRLDGFVGDWALGAFDSAGQPFAVSDQYLDEDRLDRPEHVRILLRRPGTVVVVRACNLAGGPQARVRYAFQPL